MTWRLDGTYFENCSCDMVCPCTTSGLTMPADQDRCRVVLAFHVDRGEVDGLDVSDKTVVVVADTPQVMAEGNWRLGVIMDSAASRSRRLHLVQSSAERWVVRWRGLRHSSGRCWAWSPPGSTMSTTADDTR